MHAIDPGPLSNKLLAALPRNDFQHLLSHLALVALAQGDVLYEAGAEVDQVYFPLSGMISLLVVMQDGKAIETATVGREGAVGAMSGLGSAYLEGSSRRPTANGWQQDISHGAQEAGRQQ